LFTQQLQYGYWKVRVIQKHKAASSIRHLVPGIYIITLIFLVFFSVFFKPAFYILSAILCLYLIISSSVSSYICLKSKKLKLIPNVIAAFAAYHYGYGYGFLRGIIDFIALKRGGQKTFMRQTNV
jgi:succinoglycan biosynthesis protein ExoA